MTDLDLDYSERAGFLVGKSAAIAEWRHKKERGEFDRLVNVLRVKKWVKENPEKRRANANRYAAKPEVRSRYLEQAKARRARKKRDGKVFTCRECGATWCRAPWTRGLAGAGKFCDDSCGQRFRYQSRRAA